VDDSYLNKCMQFLLITRRTRGKDIHCSTLQYVLHVDIAESVLHDVNCVLSGSTVGAVGAHSIGEPGTQMTLKTFHFAGEYTRMDVCDECDWVISY
jgi:hypothetical protein